MPSHRYVHADNLPAPAGPYSPATVFERLVFVAGQGARVPETNALAGPDIEAQTEQCLRNVEAILVAAGSSLQHVLRCGVFLIDMAEFDRMNRVYERMFAGHKPARTTVQAAALPARDLRVEIDCVAYIP
jgi:2-iminobutanoate/2-iminopropanoate deaminase